MRIDRDLRSELSRIDGRGYRAYKDIRGSYDLGACHLFIDHVQGDPFASPSEMRVRVAGDAAGFPPEMISDRTRRRALEDFIARATAAAIRRHAKGRRGTGKGGQITVDAGGQQVLERTAVAATAEYVEARLFVGLPASGRRVLGEQAAEMLLSELPEVAEASLLYCNLDAEHLWQHVESVEDQVALRDQLRQRGLVAFVANGSVLPRESGVSQCPMRGEGVVRFESPEELQVELETPHSGPVRGMGIPEGVTLIVGGGYHGKSTLLNAIMYGVYDHVPGNGRERVVTVESAVKIRAEDGRRVAGVDISPFITDLPGGTNTTSFETDNASGSTSQAANIIEALVVGAKLLLVDEDTSATNFMIRDARMQRLVPKSGEPITPFVDRVRELYEVLGVSTVLVMGGSGDYFDLADTVILMDGYRPRCVTEEARRVAAEVTTPRETETPAPLRQPTPRCPQRASIDPSKGKRDVRIRSRGVDEIAFGTEDIDLSQVEQIVDPSQTRAIGDAINYARERYVDGDTTIEEIAARVQSDIDEGGLTVLSPIRGRIAGNYAHPRRFEIAAAMNRLRTLRVREVGR